MGIICDRCSNIIKKKEDANVLITLSLKKDEKEEMGNNLTGLFENSPWGKTEHVLCNGCKKFLDDFFAYRKMALEAMTAELHRIIDLVVDNKKPKKKKGRKRKE